MSADLVRLCIFTNYIHYSNIIAQMIKEKDSNTPIEIGSSHSTFYPIRALSDIPAADIRIERKARLGLT
jgi:hypothetical protein